MSSHHFVKENQEPALLILDTEGLSFEAVAPLLEWVPTVLISQEEVWSVISWGIKVDVILADLEFQRANYRLLEEQYPVKFLGVQRGNFLEEGLQYLVATKHSAVNIVGLAPWEVKEIPNQAFGMDIVLWKSGVRYFPIQAASFKKWVPNGEIRLFAPEKSAISIKSGKGLSTMELSGETTIAVPEGFLEIAAEGTFWIGEKM
jgi:hypothetical protein